MKNLLLLTLLVFISTASNATTGTRGETTQYCGGFGAVQCSEGFRCKRYQGTDFGTCVATPSIPPYTQPDSSRCEAAKNIGTQLSKIYIVNDLYCTKDADCSEVNYVGGSLCGARMVNAVGKAGYELMLESTQYKRIKQIVDAADFCGPIPSCAPRPEGELKCISAQCQFKML
ncbi:MAG: hypothetical protein ISR65_07270 [Bacteriovoracaceae bacterium]|nr:hypothetical protein [Bacteriovoracaceae bacterium]